MTNRKPTLLKLAIIAGLLAFLFGCSSKINQENYAKIKNGMTMEQVKAVLGEPTESKTSDIGAALSTTNTIWKNRSGATINVKFVNGKVLLKTFVNQ
ncbi:MAG: hypothetical protein DRR19_26600 [Candidatus Parabeggiatoa sp. nov. 1]|nr:MAG: hypothetical protein DRR19_26600 [Gammaproteobacteria bacterium]